MFERFTEQARRTLFFARYEASLLGSIAIVPEHLALGLLREGQDIADLVSAEIADAIRGQILQGITERPPVRTSVEIPFSREAKRVLDATEREADALHHSHIGTEHLLLALAAAADPNLREILDAHGLQADTLRKQIGQRPSPPSGRPLVSVPANADAVTPLRRREGAIQQLDAILTFVRSIGDEHAATPEAQRLVDQICRDVAALKMAISGE